MFKYSSRFWLYAPTMLFLLLAVAVMVHWWMAAGAFEKKLAALKGREAVPGITLNWDKVEVGGFPFRLDGKFQNLNIAGAGAHGPFFWRSEKFAMHGLTYGRSQDVYEAAGRQQINWTDAKGKSVGALFVSGSMRGSSSLDGKGLKRFDLDIAELQGQRVTIARLQFHMRRDPNGSDLDLMARIDSLYWRHTIDSGFMLIETYATLKRAAPLHSLLRGEESWPQAVANWRRGGGVLQQNSATVNVRGITHPKTTAAEIFHPLY